MNGKAERKRRMEALRDRIGSEKEYRAVIVACNDTQLVNFLKKKYPKIWEEFKAGRIDEGQNIANNRS